MSTYAKAWLFALVWTLLFATGLLGFALMVLDEEAKISGFFMGAIGITGYFLMAWLAQHFPKCPNCREPVNEPVTSMHGTTVSFRPDRPPRECGYCGHDLT